MVLSYVILLEAMLVASTSCKIQTTDKKPVKNNPFNWHYKLKNNTMQLMVKFAVKPKYCIFIFLNHCTLWKFSAKTMSFPAF